MALLLAAICINVSFTQDGYRTPPDTITKILDSPTPPAVSVSSDRRWLLITTADVVETRIAELAEPTLFVSTSAPGLERLVAAIERRHA